MSPGTLWISTLKKIIVLNIYTYTHIRMYVWFVLYVYLHVCTSLMTQMNKKINQEPKTLTGPTAMRTKDQLLKPLGHED